MNSLKRISKLKQELNFYKEEVRVSKEESLMPKKKLRKKNDIIHGYE